MVKNREEFGETINTQLLEKVKRTIGLRSATVWRVSREAVVKMEQLVEGLTKLTGFQRQQQERFEEAMRYNKVEKKKPGDAYTKHNSCKWSWCVNSIDLRLRHYSLEWQNVTPETHLKTAPFEENPRLSGCIRGKYDNPTNGQGGWVLRLTPLLSGKTRTVCTRLEPKDSNGVKVANNTMSTTNNVNDASLESSAPRTRSLWWAQITNGVKLLNRRFTLEDRVDAIKDKIAVEQLINALPQGLRVWVATHEPKKPAEVAKLIETYDSTHARAGGEDKPGEISEHNHTTNCHHRWNWKLDVAERIGQPGSHCRRWFVSSVTKRATLKRIYECRGDRKRSRSLTKGRSMDDQSSRSKSTMELHGRLSTWD